MIDLARALRNPEKGLKEGQVYSYYKLPIVGGGYAVDNFCAFESRGTFRVPWRYPQANQGLAGRNEGRNSDCGIAMYTKTKVL